MLVLTRRIGEAILIGDDVRVAVLEARGNRVRIGIQAPLSVGVQREELVRDASPSTIAKRKRQAT